MNKTFRLTVVLSLLLVSFAVLIAASPPEAPPDTDTNPRDDYSREEITGDDSDDVQAQEIPSPSGCEIITHDVHQSSHKPGRMNAEVETVCNSAVTKMYFVAQLWEKRWSFPLWNWKKIGTKGIFLKFGVSSGSAFANDVCRDKDIRVTGTGYVIDVDGERYDGEAIGPTFNNPCNL